MTKNHFGFAFDGDRLFDYKTNNFIDNTYILNARTLKRNEGEYQPIFRTLVKDFIRAYLRNSSSGGSQLKGDTIDKFKKDVGAWKTQIGKYKNSDPINLLLREGEDIIEESVGDDSKSKTLKVKLSGGQDLVDIEIVD